MKTALVSLGRNLRRGLSLLRDGEVKTYTTKDGLVSNMVLALSSTLRGPLGRHAGRPVPLPKRQRSRLTLRPTACRTTSSAPSTRTRGRPLGRHARRARARARTASSDLHDARRLAEQLRRGDCEDARGRPLGRHARRPEQVRERALHELHDKGRAARERRSSPLRRCARGGSGSARTAAGWACSTAAGSKSFTSRDGLPNDTLYRILGDAAGVVDELQEGRLQSPKARAGEFAADRSGV